jgi:hypothetical protein
LSELFGGVIPICAAGELRDETWLQQRVIDRISVGLVTGETDFNRGEVERFRGPLLSRVGVRSRIWVVPRVGHGLPDDATLRAVYDWLEENVAVRRQLASRWPATSAATVPGRKEQARFLMAEAKQRIAKPENTKLLYSGLMLMKGIYTRWPDLPEAAEAEKLLLHFENDANSRWQTEDVAHQRLFLIARARSLDAYASGQLPEVYAAGRPKMAEAALQLWKMVIDDGQDKQAVAEGKRRIAELSQMLE